MNKIIIALSRIKSHYDPAKDYDIWKSIDNFIKVFSSEKTTEADYPLLFSTLQNFCNKKLPVKYTDEITKEIEDYLF